MRAVWRVTAQGDLTHKQEMQGGWRRALSA
jgi:hypothetical protein